MTIRLENGDCLKMMKELPDKSIDLFICDLPYSETNCKWDVAIDMDQFWIEFKRLRKSKKTACIHFCSTKFGYKLIKSWEKGFKMDMVWKKRNKTGGLQSRHRPMRNHEMVYFFYEQSPKYNRDKYHKRIASVPNPASVINEVETDELENDWGYGNATKTMKTFKKKQAEFEPKLPVSVVEDLTMEEEDKRINEKGKSAHGWDIEYMDKPRVAHFDPKLPVSVLEEKKEITKLNNPCDGKISKLNSIGIDLNKHSAYANKPNFTPLLPASVVEEEDTMFGEKKNERHERYLKCGCGDYDPPNPASVFESSKVFIGKRHHQTEKPQDILEFFIKYWTDEDDTILDPTMGSGSTGVACKNLKRNFIGYELNKDIFKVADKRIND